MWQYAYCNLYFGQKKKYWLQVRILDFYHKLFPWARMIPLSPHCCCCIHVYCDIHLWWLYNMLENYKLHHPCNDNTRTMQKQCFFFLSKFVLFFHVCTCCACYVAHANWHSSLKNEIINLTNVGKYGSVTESHNLWSFRVFRGCWSQVSDSDLTSFLPQTCSAMLSHVS